MAIKRFIGLILLVFVLLSSVTVNAEESLSDNDSDTLTYESVLKLIANLEESADEYIELSKSNSNYNKYEYDRDTLVFTYLRDI